MSICVANVLRLGQTAPFRGQCGHTSSSALVSQLAVAFGKTPFGMHRMLTRELWRVRPFLSGSCIDPVGVLCQKVTATCYRVLCTDKRILSSSF